MGSPFIVVCGARNVKTILTGEDVLVTINPSPVSKVVFGERALSTSIGSAHSVHYRTTLRAFSSQNVARYSGRIADMLHQRVTDWCRRRHIYAVPELKRLIFEIGSEVILGFQFGSAETEKLLTEFDEFSANFFSLNINLPGSGLWRALRSRDRLVTILRENQSSERSCIIDLDVNTESDADKALELLFGMTETSVSAGAAMMTLVSQRRDVIARVRQEIDDARRARRSEQLESGSTPYVNGVVKEVLRLRPPVAGGFRTALKTFQLDVSTLTSSSYTMVNAHSHLAQTWVDVLTKRCHQLL